MYGVAIVGLRLRDNVLKVRLLQPNTGKQSASGVSFGGLNLIRAKIE